MGRYSAGEHWEDVNRKQQEAESQALKAQKAATNQALRAQLQGLPSLPSLDDIWPVGEPPYPQDPEPTLHRRRRNLPELEARATPPPQYRQRASLTSPPSHSVPPPQVGSTERTVHLQQEVLQKESRIKSLEAEIQVERTENRHLHAERHAAVDAQRRAAADEIAALKRQVANLDQLLDDSRARERKLEGELDACRQESRELKRQLHDERCGYESDVGAREVRERHVRRQLEDTKSELEHEMRRGRRADREVGSVREHEVQGEWKT